MTKEEFIKAVAGIAVIIGKRYDVPPSFLIAQTALESGFGKSLLATKYYNLTGMKTGSKKGIWTGKEISMKTGEYTKEGVPYEVFDNFRIYTDWKQSIEDTAHRHAVRFKTTLSKFAGSIVEWFKAILNTGYATDPRYAKKISDLVAQYNLTAFDKISKMVEPKKKKVGGKKTKCGRCRPA